MITVHYMGNMRNYTHTRTERVELPPAGDLDLKGLLALLVDKHGEEFESRLFTVGGNLHNQATVMVGEADVSDNAGAMEMKLRPGDEVTILTVTTLSGGSC
ncbi:MAG: MoaD/ThiS family protein [Firmicutes bacterium]|nr:MoaD/ThiS family protein [Bacillota bacterium]